MIIDKIYGICPNCNGSGFFDVIQESEDKTIVYMCQKCRYTLSFVTTITQEEKDFLRKAYQHYKLYAEIFGNSCFHHGTHIEICDICRAFTE